jgi:hypothetical protein
VGDGSVVVAAAVGAATDALVDAPAVARADAAELAEGDAVVDGAALVAVTRGFVLVLVVVDVVALVLGAFVGAGAGGATADAGAVPGGSAVPPFCQENATVAPAGTFNEPAPREEYFQPEVPSDQ